MPVSCSAISFSSKISYGLYKVTDAPADNWAKTGDLLILADKLAEDVFKQARVTSYEKAGDVSADILDAIECSHPLKGLAGGYEFVTPKEIGEARDETQVKRLVGSSKDGSPLYAYLMKIKQALEAVGLPTRIPGKLDMRRVHTSLALDKKGKDGMPLFVLPKAIGASAIDVPVPDALIRSVLA